MRRTRRISPPTLSFLPRDVVTPHILPRRLNILRRARRSRPRDAPGGFRGFPRRPAPPQLASSRLWTTTGRAVKHGNRKNRCRGTQRGHYALRISDTILSISIQRTIRVGTLGRRVRFFTSPPAAYTFPLRDDLRRDYAKKRDDRQRN